ncbi:hypothetical protein GCM10007862_17640 [Dyella lipolytica]|uniref:Membrane domain of glycerophosphoryl diester phosphodiesterase n=1 Tax=Dyella lipolytica TaxID=1867835 RepID=A0ABW8ISU3_9GAMM|nr:hypothetical protein [Dyella lipolytica]GLQ46713.1 hypothetical protein GCM10007862_17640 [Dyella lipolytica]
MTTRSRGPSAGFGWLTRGISVGFRHKKPLLGGAAFVLLAAMIPSLITLPMQIHAMQGGTPLPPTTFGWIMAISMLFSLLTLPLYAGYLQVIDEAERGLPARARDVFKPYLEGKALRLIGYGLLQLAIYLAMFAIVIATTGRSVVSWYMQAIAAQANHLPPPTALPDGFGITILLFMVLILFMMGFYSIGLGQVALRNRSVFGAVGDGVIGALKNLLPLLVLAVSLVLAWIVVAIAFGLVALLLALLGKLVGGWLVFVVIIPLYIAFALMVFAVMFGVMYHLWHDVCGDDVATGMAESVAA